VKKKLDTTRLSHLQNELEGASLFFQRTPAPQTDTAPNAEMPANQHAGMPTSHHADKPAPTQSPLPAAEKALTEKETFRCTIDEVLAIEELKTRIKRDLDLRVSKQDIERCAMRVVIEDYRENGEKSVFVKELRKKSLR
jgi:hypothetical protein